MEFKISKRNYRIIAGLFFSILMISYFLCGYRKPWAWGYTSYILNWRFGFLPRTLVGTVFSTILGSAYYSKTVLDTIMFGIEFLFIFYMIYNIIILVGKAGNVIACMLILLFSVSTYPMFYMQIIGYLDHFGIILVAIMIEIAVRKSLRFTVVSSAILCLLSVLILETNLFTICPVIGSIAVLKYVNEKDKILIKEVVKLGICYIPTVLYGAFVCTYRVSTATIEQIKNYFQSQALDFPTIFDYALSYFVNSRITISSSIPYIPVDVILYPVLTIAITVAFLYYIEAPLKSIISYFILTSGSCLSAYLANIVATDYNRFSFFMFLSVFLITIYILRMNADKHITTKLFIGLAIVFVPVFLRVMSYRIWTFNQLYYDPWWILMLKKLF